MAHSVSLSWNASTGATSYNVKRSTVQTGPFTTVGSSTTTSFTDSGTFVEGTTYWYVATAVGPGGESGASAAVSAFIPLSIPSIPTNLHVVNIT